MVEVVVEGKVVVVGVVVVVLGGIPDICHESHENFRVNFLASANFYRCNAENWHFRLILREKVTFFTDLTRKIGVFWCKFYSPKILPV